MSISDYLRNSVVSWLFPDSYPNGYEKRFTALDKIDQYARGVQAEQLKVRPGGANDNIIANFIGLVIDRSVSMLMGKGVKFDIEDEESAAIVEGIWDANRRDILLHSLAMFGAKYGTCYAKLIPDGIIDKSGNQTTRIVALNPKFITIETAVDDIQNVTSYTICYFYNDIGYKEVCERDSTTNESGNATSWIVRQYQMDEGKKWTLINEVAWPYEWPPIVHWQHLIDPEDVYGLSEVDTTLMKLQDRVNYAYSNIGKIIRYHAHPKTWGRGIGATGKANWGPDEMITLSGDNASIQNLEMQSDLASSRSFAQDLRQIIFDLTRTVDITSMADRLGQLTNFGLRVLFMDSLAKVHTQQLLYGDALAEINRRLLSLAGRQNADGGRVIWPDPLPVDELNNANAIRTDLEAGIISRQTASQLRGYNWLGDDGEESRISNEQSQTNNIGAAILRNFQGGR